MILLDSLYINNSGGKILLDYLVEMLEDNNVSVYYLFDDRCKSDYYNIPVERKIFLKATLVNRYKFYKKNKDKFDKVFCFGNLGPPISLNMPVYTYFHQSMYLNIPKELNYYQRFVLKIKSEIFEYLLNNTDFLIVQSNLMKERVNKKFKLSKDRILTIPFYQENNLKSGVTRIKDSFIYVSGGGAHKNHKRLIEAFCAFYDKTKKGKLIITIGDNFSELLDVIILLQQKGYPIINIGFVTREDLIQYYYASEYLIFPSLEESFGLGIAEAIDGGCKVIGANLPYIYEVCRPSIIFNPTDIKDIERAFYNAIEKKEQKTEKKIYNQIDELLNILNNNARN